MTAVFSSSNSIPHSLPSSRRGSPAPTQEMFSWASWVAPGPSYVTCPDLLMTHSPSHPQGPCSFTRPGSAIARPLNDTMIFCLQRSKYELLFKKSHLALPVPPQICSDLSSVTLVRHKNLWNKVIPQANLTWISLSLQGFSLLHHHLTKNSTQYGFKNLSIPKKQNKTRLARWCSRQKLGDKYMGFRMLLSPYS